MPTLRIREVLPGGARARVVRLDLDGQSFVFRPGQAVFVADRGHVKRKPYSLATAPLDAQRADALELLVGVDKAGRAGTHLTLEGGQQVDVEGPVGGFVFPENPKEHHLLFIAGGTGIAPIRSMLRYALGLQGRAIGLHYSARTPADFAYEQELRVLADRGLIELSLTATREHHNSAWHGKHGRLARSDLGTFVHDPETLCFICGPPALVRDVPAMLTELGIPEDHIRIERW